MKNNNSYSELEHLELVARFRAEAHSRGEPAH